MTDDPIPPPHKHWQVYEACEKGGYCGTAVTRLDYDLKPVPVIHDNGYLVIENAYDCTMFHVYDRYLFEMESDDL
jgi:hypothetical protein